MKPNRRTLLKQMGLGAAVVVLAQIKVFGMSKKDILKKVPETFSKLQNVSKMKLGAFSVSLSVKDIKVSKQFYENLGFSVFAGDINKNYLIMKNEHALIGLFQGMFENNILTFNPGWDENAQKLDTFEDIRKIQQRLKQKGIQFETEADENGSGPASFTILDPDGNAILLDQHV
jgi:catechol 2,3-dioxygenase-like lactoylglutathione lyase family enzyme